MDKDFFEKELIRWLPKETTRPQRLHAAMAYSLRPPAKRLRPELVIAAWELAPNQEDPYPAAAAVEYAHTYSLIHDDLPCMDDSPLRRGKPSCHTQFDEATALLAGNALLARAFWVLSQAYDVQRVQSLTACLASTLGSQALMGGQMEDIMAQNMPQEASPQSLEFIHRNKTAVLLTASLHMGAWISQNNTPQHLGALSKLGLNMGLAFQFIDDLLDFTQCPEALGKPASQDTEKLTAIAVYGHEGAQQKAAAYLEAARCTAQSFPNPTGLLRTLEPLEARNAALCC